MTFESIRIKNAEAQDIDALVLLLEQLFSIEKDFTFDVVKHRKGLQLFLDGCKKHRVIKTAWAGSQLVGMCTAQTRISTARGGINAVLEDLVVDETCRGKGIGTALLEAMHDWARRMGIGTLTLLADRENTPALDFYARRQWESTQLVCLVKTTG